MAEYTPENPASAEALKQNAVSKMWLQYYNDLMLEQGFLSQSQHSQLKIQIKNRKPSGFERQ